MTQKRFEAHIHCGDGGEHYHDGIIDNLDKSKKIIRNYHSISVIMNNIWEQTQRFEKHNQKLEKVYGSLIDENEQLKKQIEWCRSKLNTFLTKTNELNDENEQLYELVNFANTLIAFKTSESCQKEWEKRLKELQE